MMPNAIDGAIKNMCEDAVTQAVATLAEKHGFDAEEALRELALDDLKVVRKRGPSGSSVEKAAAKGKKKAASDKPKVKRGTTGYLLYAAAMRPSVKEAMTDALEEGAKLQPQAVVSEIAKLWKAESEEDRTEWNEKAKAENAAASSPASSPQGSDTELDVLEEATPAPAPKPAAKKAAKADTGDKPKRTQTGYLRYAAAMRPTVKSEMPDLKPQEVVTEVAKRWKAEEEAVRDEWNAKALVEAAE